MNLHIADARDLVGFLHQIIAEDAEPLLVVEKAEVVNLRGWVFYHGLDPVTVGGPFRSLEALLRSQGLRRHMETDSTPVGDPLFEVFEWRGSFFRIEPKSSEEPRQYRELEGAVRGGA